MNFDLVSIIVTSYNHAEYLDQRMRSLLEQTYPNIEIIVIDDFSTDGSVAVLRKYEELPAVRIVALQSNGGYAHATNLGVSLARGEFVMIAECDDYSEPEHVSRLYTGLQKSESIGVAYCRSAMVDGQGQVLGSDFSGREKRFKNMCFSDTVITSQDMQSFLLRACVIPNMSAALFRKQCYEKAGGLSPKYRVCADWDFWCHLATICDFYYVAAELNNFRTHSTSVRNTAGIKIQTLEIFEVLYTARSRITLSIEGRIRFRTAIGVIWASYLFVSPKSWVEAFPSVLVKALRLDAFILVNLFLGFAYKTLTLAKRVFDKNR